MKGKVIYCEACGASLSSDNKFCEYCGAKIFLDKGDGDLIEYENEAMMVEDIFVITGRGTVVTGKARSAIKVGMNLANSRTNQIHTVRGIEQFRKVSDSVEIGTNCGLLFNGDRKDFERGDMLLIK